jgi:DNA-binding MarR family transcriptional regulator
MRAPGVRGAVAANEEEPEAPSLGKVLDFMRVMWGLNHRFETLSRRMEQRLGVTAPQRFAVRLVGRFPDSSAGHIASLLAIHPSTLTGVIKRLQQRGLLDRQADREDRRRALLRLTDEGRRLDATRTGTVESALRRALGRFDAAQLDTAKAVLAAISEELDRE